MDLVIAAATECDIIELPTARLMSLAELHVVLQRYLSDDHCVDQCKFLVDLRQTVVEAGRDEVPLFIDFLRRRLLPWLRARSGALILLAGQVSAASPLGSVLTAVANLAEFADRVIVAPSFESAYRALPETA